MKETYIAKILDYVGMLDEATQGCMFKSAVAHLYGEVASFEYYCVLNPGMDSEQGQRTAKAVEDICLEILNANGDVTKWIDELLDSVDELLMFIRSK